MIDKLIEKIDEKKAPIVVGLDPQISMIPDHIRKESEEKFGSTLEALAESFFLFNKEIVNKTCDLIPAVKPQIAMYEALGVPGVAAYKRTIDYCHDKGLVVIGDIKRGDIGSTAGQYAVGHIGSIQVGNEEIKPFDTDFVTINPYMGSDAIKPFTDICKTHDRGIFVLCKTSNPSSGELQDMNIEGIPVYEHVARLIEKWGEELIGSCGYSDVAAVVGATYPEMGEELRAKFPHMFFLIPGYGAQGAGARELAGFFDKNGRGGIVNSSRGIIAAYKNEKYASYGAKNFAEASRAAVLDMKKDLEQAVG